MIRRTSIMAAVATNGVIGRNGKLPWLMKSDLSWFRYTTTGHTVIMGRKTFESLPKLLSNRQHIVVSRQPALSLPDNVRLAPSVTAALDLCKDDDQPFVIGGTEVFAEAIPLASRMYLTYIHAYIEGDTHFPKWDRNDWWTGWSMDIQHDKDNQYACTQTVLVRKHRHDGFVPYLAEKNRPVILPAYLLEHYNKSDIVVAFPPVAGDQMMTARIPKERFRLTPFGDPVL